MKLIDLDEVKEAYQDKLEHYIPFDMFDEGYLHGIECVIDTMEAMHESNSTEYQVVKRGKWKRVEKWETALCGGLVLTCMLYCSNCHESNVYESKYCPNCGAKMENGI